MNGSLVHHEGKAYNQLFIVCTFIWNSLMIIVFSWESIIMLKSDFSGLTYYLSFIRLFMYSENAFIFFGIKHGSGIIFKWGM